MKIFNVRDYGAKTADTLQTDAIQKAIDDCFLAGGGRVVIPCGVFLTGGLRIRSGVELYLESGAILKGSREAKDYFGYREDKIEPVVIQEEVPSSDQRRRSMVPTSRWNNALIRALDAHDFAIIGEKGSYIDGCNAYDREGEHEYRNCYMGDLFQTGMLWGDAEDKVICRFKNVTFACCEGAGEVPLLAVGNVEKLLFEDCTFEGYTKPAILVGTDDADNIEVVRSGEIEVRKVSFEDCILAHPSGIAKLDRGKLNFWSLKDPDAPPVPGPESLREKLADVQRG